MKERIKQLNNNKINVRGETTRQRKVKAHVQEHEAWRTLNTCDKEHNTSCYAVKFFFFFCTKDSESQLEFTSPRNRVRYVKTLAYSLGSPMVCASIMISVFLFVQLAILRVCMQIS